MFCPKCGTKALDGTTFCQKCGAKLIVGHTEQQVAASTPVRQTQSPTPLDTPKMWIYPAKPKEMVTNYL